MHRSEFSYRFPPELIAQEPLPERGASRLLCLDGATGAVADGAFADLHRILVPGDLLVLNDTRVIPARLFGRKTTGASVELLVERIIAGDRALVHLRASKPTRVGARILLDGEAWAEVRARREELFELVFDRPVAEVLEAHGHVPLPPYIRRADGPADRERYQTVFARYEGAVAAPTAGLHFTRAMLEQLATAGVDQARITLHVGVGTFQPVRTERLEEHRMQAERYSVGEALCESVAATRRAGGRVVAVGTTVVRSLESAAMQGQLQPVDGETTLFITPGYRFRVVDAMLTNFHLPESTLLMLVAAFGGYEHVMAAYRHAVARRYRFYSYGDAMYLSPHPAAVTERRS